MSIKFVTINGNVFQLLGGGGTSPKLPTGAPPLDPLGDFNPPTDPLLCSSKISFKNPLFFSVQFYTKVQF